jgi:hypothetical protein
VSALPTERLAPRRLAWTAAIPQEDLDALTAIEADAIRLRAGRIVARNANDVWVLANTLANPGAVLAKEADYVLLHTQPPRPLLTLPKPRTKR